MKTPELESPIVTLFSYLQTHMQYSHLLVSFWTNFLAKLYVTLCIGVSVHRCHGRLDI